jgi:hypothetical protein
MGPVEPPAELIALDLTDVEQRVLRSGLLEWGGPARCTAEMAVAMGFQSVDDLLRSGAVLAAAVHAGHPLSALDWRRTLLATEISFASDLMGSGVEWATTTGLSDEDTLAALRSVQRKMPHHVSAALSNGIGMLPTVTNDGHE